MTTVKSKRAPLNRRHQKEREAAAEQRFRLVVEAAPNAMIMINQAGSIIMLNVQAERDFGYSRDELLGQPVEMLVPERFRGHHPGLRGAFFANPRVRPMGTGRDLYGLRKDGREFPVEIGLNPIETEEGMMVLSAIVDITERKMAEAALKESQRRLQELHAELLHVSRLSAIGQMAATVTHELHQPLTAISNYTEAARALLARGGDLPVSRISDAMERAGEQAIRAGEIIQRWCAFASHGDGEKRVEAITPLVKEATELALVGTKLQGISITLQDGSAGAAVVADKIQIQQVLLNLLRNAAEAVADQEYQDIALRTEARDDIVQISVVDNGPGIPAEVQAKLFRPFVSTKKTGMGVGLSICHTIIAAHAGRLWAEPNPDGGSIFHITLPATLASARVEA
jgi:two-component system sensor kinase FixL